MKRYPDDMKSILITGSNGLLGQNLLLTAPDSVNLLGTDIQDTPWQNQVRANYQKLDITNYKQVHDLMRSYRPDVVLNAAAYTNVDGAETERELCWQVNVIGVENLARAARLIKSKIVHVSTDYIFDGQNGPYREDALANPQGYYARSKLAAENALIAIEAEHAIVRTMVLYGAGIKVKNNFPLWVIHSLRQGQTIRVVDDQIGTSTLASELALAMWRIVELDKMEIFNISSPDLMSRYEFARRIALAFDLDSTLITVIKTADLEQPAPRPLNSGLIVEKAQRELGLDLLTTDQALIKFKRQFLGNKM